MIKVGTTVTVSILLTGFALWAVGKKGILGKTAQGFAKIITEGYGQ